MECGNPVCLHYPVLRNEYKETESVKEMLPCGSKINGSITTPRGVKEDITKL
jgi:hypothetical protein